ncbi:MAG: IS630 family transposase [Chloroflexi bacterium]|nr:IS630 family transposase [Chloroflexota bacterium]
MANHVKVLELAVADRAALERQVRSESGPARCVERARIVLLAAEGLPATAIAERVGCSRPTVIHWRQRYERGGLAALADAPRSGRPKRLPEDIREVILAATLAPPPSQLGVTHWSSRLLGQHLGISHMTVARLWREYGLQPWRQETFKFSTDPELEAKVRDVVGLYLNPPEAAVVLCVDEKSQIQALDRTAPMLPLRPGQPERRTHDYKRNGTTTLFAALEIATGKVTDACYPRHRHTEFLQFLKQVARAYPRQPLHIVVDNYGTHKHDAVKRWLRRNPRVQLHFTPTSSSWLNLVVSIITRQAIRRGAFPSVADLIAAIRRFIDAWNERCDPFIWTKDEDTVLSKANRQDRAVTRH